MTNLRTIIAQAQEHTGGMMSTPADRPVEVRTYRGEVKLRRGIAEWMSRGYIVQSQSAGGGLIRQRRYTVVFVHKSHQ